MSKMSSCFSYCLMTLLVNWFNEFEYKDKFTGLITGWTGRSTFCCFRKSMWADFKQGSSTNGYAQTCWFKLILQAYVYTLSTTLSKAE